MTREDSKAEHSEDMAVVHRYFLGKAIAAMRSDLSVFFKSRTGEDRLRGSRSPWLRYAPLLILCLLPFLFAAPLAVGLEDSDIIRVGPGRALTLPSQAARIAPSGSVVEIDAGDYYGDVAVWRQHDLTLRGVGGRARLHADGQIAQGRAIWVLRGDRVLIEKIELSGASAADHNGAAIRYEGAALTLRHCRLHHNEMGLLTLARSDARVVIENSEIDHSYSETAIHGKLGHGIYIGRIAALTLHNSHVHHASQGHLVKSRAQERDNRQPTG